MSIDAALQFVDAQIGEGFSHSGQRLQELPRLRKVGPSWDPCKSQTPVRDRWGIDSISSPVWAACIKLHACIMSGGGFRAATCLIPRKWNPFEKIWWCMNSLASHVHSSTWVECSWPQNQMSMSGMISSSCLYNTILTAVSLPLTVPMFSCLEKSCRHSWKNDQGTENWRLIITKRHYK